MSAVITAFMEANGLLDELGDLLENGPENNETDAAFLTRVKDKYAKLGDALNRITPEDISDEYFSDEYFDNDESEV